MSKNRERINVHQKALRIKHSFLSIALIYLFIIFFPGCSRLKYDIIPDANATYNTITLGVNVKIQSEGQKSKQSQSFKILLKYDGVRDKMLFLSPLNQVYGQLFIENEKVLLINSKKERCWRGRFKTLINEIWALDFNYSEFKELLLVGTIPQKKAQESSLKVSLEKEEGSDKPARIRIEYNDVTLRIKISDRRSGKGIIDFSPRLEKVVQKGTIEEVLGEEE